MDVVIRAAMPWLGGLCFVVSVFALLALLIGGAIVAFVELANWWRRRRELKMRTRTAARGTPLQATLQAGGVPVKVSDLCLDGQSVHGCVRLLSLPWLRDARIEQPEYAGIVLVYDEDTWIGTGFHSFGVWYWEDGTEIRGGVTHWRDLLI